MMAIKMLLQFQIKRKIINTLYQVYVWYNHAYRKLGV